MRYFFVDGTFITFMKSITISSGQFLLARKSKYIAVIVIQILPNKKYITDSKNHAEV